MINAVILPFSTRAFEHNELSERDAADAHPISAITGLSEEISGRYTKGETDTLLEGKQKKLTAGANVHIYEDGTIEASGEYATTWGLLAGNIEDQEDLMDEFDAVSGLVTAESEARSAADTSIIAKLTNRNLLDNPWFTVNQREATTWTSGCGVDRWEVTNGEADTQIPGGLNTAPDTVLIQKLESDVKNYLHDKTVTLSARLSNGEVYSGHKTYKKDEQVIFVVDPYFNLFCTSEGNVCFQTKSDYGVTIRAIKLELGQTSTLANDAPPDYGEELRKCMRYFQRVKAGSGALTIGVSIASGASSMYFPFVSCVPMASTPTALCTPNDSGNVFILTKTTSSAAVAYFDSAENRISDANKLFHTLYISKPDSGLTVGDHYKILIAANACFDLSSEL